MVIKNHFIITKTILNAGYTILLNIMLKIVYNVELLQTNGLMKIN